MSDQPKDHLPENSIHEETVKHDGTEGIIEETVSFVPGDSVIDIGALRRAQSGQDLDLDLEAREILNEFENDPELQDDVLRDFDALASDEKLDQIADAVSVQEQKDIEVMEALASQVSDDLRKLNEDLIADDMILENPELRAQLLAGTDEEEDETPTAEELSEEEAALRNALPQANESGEYDLVDLQSCIDTLLFYSDRPLSLKKMKEMLEMTEAEDEPLLQAIAHLKESYQTSSRGFEIAEIAGGYQFRTKPSKAPLLRKLAKVQVQRLSKGAMETLTICAYKQPCTKDDIDQVRGVDSSHFIRTLLDRKLIEVGGRSEAVGRPMIYKTTDTFLEVFGLMDLSGLPPLREIEAMVPQLAASEEGAEDPRVIQMRKLVTQMKTESNHLDYDAREDERILQEIRERVKTIDISTPYLERQKALAEQGIVGDEAEAILAKEFGFDGSSSGGEPIAETTDQPASELPASPTRDDQLSLEELAQIAALNATRERDTDSTDEESI
ncbi:MAG: SMC-Scp complex subunit ScpB [Proteobacteria bacterium]|nr:SMC-Scp complex subunit ScpB [Pseudomonadota bacterium]